MAKTIKNVALTGATGNVGSNVLNALLDLKQFNITVLTRSGGKVFPVGVTVKIVDFNSVPALTEALKGIDAVIDTTQSPDSETPLRLIEAAVQARVSRFVPSDFGMGTSAAVQALPVFGRKKASFEAVKAAAAKSPSFTYTVVANGPFLDWNLETGFMWIDLKGRKATLLGVGANVFAWTTLASIGRATANVLLHLSETENRTVYIHDVIMNQGQMVEKCKEALGGEWEVTSKDMKKVFEKSMADMQAGILTWDVFGDQIRYAASSKEFLVPWPQDDNALLGLKGMSDAELKELIKELAAK